MGMYDTIMVPCPKCAERTEFQTKSGECLLHTWNLEDAPADALGDVNRHAPYTCEKCGTIFFVKLTVTGVSVEFPVKRSTI
jgi:hypothetical protein